MHLSQVLYSYTNRYQKGLKGFLYKLEINFSLQIGNKHFQGVEHYMYYHRLTFFLKWVFPYSTAQVSLAGG